MVAYIAIDVAIKFAFGREQRSVAALVADAAAFAGSSALLLTIYIPQMLPAIGSLTPYLVYAGLCGLLVSLKGLLPTST